MSAAKRSRGLDGDKTGLSGVRNHADRRLGAWLGVLHGLSLEEVRSVGLWEQNQCDQHYLKYQGACVVSKLAGFPSPAEYSIPRSQISIEHFIQQNGGEEFFRGFLGFVYDEEMIAKANKLLAEGFNAPRNVLDALTMLHQCFFQNLYLYYDYKKDLKMFSAELFKTHESTFHRWMEYCKIRVQEISSEFQSVMPSTLAPQTTFPGSSDSVGIGIKMDLNSAKLDRLIYLLEPYREATHESTSQCVRLLQRDYRRMQSIHSHQAICILTQCISKGAQKSTVPSKSDKSSTSGLQSLRPLRGDCLV